jgi:hypothetical protein
MPNQDQSIEGTEAIDDSMIWQIWVSDSLNKEADVLVRWSRTSFFGGSPISRPRTFSGREYTLFYRCSEEWSMKYVLAIAISNFGYIKLARMDREVPIEPFMLGRSGGMC